MTGSTPTFSGSSPKPHSGGNVNVTSFLSSIPENSSTLYHHYSDPDLEIHSSGGRRSNYSYFTDVDLEDTEFIRRIHSDNDLHGRNVGKFVKREGKDLRRGEVNGDGYYSMDYSPSLSSESYESAYNLKHSVPGRTAARADRARRRGSLESTTDSESSGMRSSSGRNIDRGFTFSAEPRLPRRRSSNDLPRSSQSSVKRQPPQSRTQRQLASSANSITVPNQGHGRSDTSNRSSSYSNRKSDSSSFNQNRSETGRSSLQGSRHQSIFSLGRSAVSAEMVSSNPSAAANVAFASLELPPDLKMTSSKQLRQMCSRVVTCLLLATLVASLGAAVYFAVALTSE